MKSAKKDRGKVRADSLLMRLSKEEKNKLEEAADKRGLTMSALARMIITEYLNNNE